MNLVDWLSDTRVQIAATLVTVLIGGYFYLEHVLDRVDLLMVKTAHEAEIEKKDDKDWKDEEMRELQDLGREHMELRRMILEYCK